MRGEKQGEGVARDNEGKTPAIGYRGTPLRHPEIRNRADDCGNADAYWPKESPST